MQGFQENLLKVIEEKNLHEYLFLGNFGLEKENLRVDKKGRLALTAHPKAFGKKVENSYIKADFSESQVEVITPAFDSIDESYNFLENLQDIVSLNLEEEYLWPQSNPPYLPEAEEIIIAKMENRHEEEYREELSKKYGKKRQLISGIHYNFSFKDSFIEELYDSIGTGEGYKEFRNNFYLRITRNFLRYRWLIIYLTGASPIFHETYIEGFMRDAFKINNDSYSINNMVSLRNSIYGYKNKEDCYVSFNSVEKYVEDLKGLVNNGKLISHKEFYNPIRLKTSVTDDLLQQLLDGGINYLEVRILDLNPMYKNGVSKESLYFMHLFILLMLFIEDKPLTEEEQRIANTNHDLVAISGMADELFIFEDDGSKILLKDKALEILTRLEELASVLDFEDKYKNIIKSEKRKILNNIDTVSEEIVKSTKNSSFIEFHMNKAKQYLEESKKKEFNFIGFEDLELSTQILLKDAVTSGINIEVLDKSENFISLSKNGKKEYIKQATKTSKDSYSTVLIMENKLVTKKVLSDNNIRVPKGRDYDEVKSAVADFKYFKDKKIVIKPKSTNFGIGITIFKESFSKEDYEKALEMAFRHDNTVLIEEFFSGKEYRFLVIDNEVVGILHRVPANVIGDGIKNITELIEEKNLDPLRGHGYKTPLEKIKLGESEELFLKNQGKSSTYIPKKDERVFLRENSNISTGGDSIDFTDDIHGSYKEIAIKSASAVNARICGVDMMIDNISEIADNVNYGIIELNFNPAIHIHCYPYKGKNRKAGQAILKLLF
ncbi:bifunctional glutamate--cysteine ligase GshA/glutathione synthetase GshB [Clostridium cellulovorans]|uniref:Glutathione biosynthesis bifunctional protein GshAB n=1 Tax=Clostridium cellulovorans (strain ATCC 35296 / DSM 3052 / OCM 3 / 743B) TaxID=573061 RepID=D9SVS3_CLOC7|nr:bifunctional glutamate--cysteine ligase GshA/glutathione synthetase GshB [Clostridium cellulovorans]ADL53134.1 glutamate/cysteine ligase, /amino acid ligase [Clostridium cellulovorans 743B]